MDATDPAMSITWLAVAEIPVNGGDPTNCAASREQEGKGKEENDKEGEEGT